MLNVRPASAKASVSIVAIRSANSRDNCRSRSTSTVTPAASIRASTAIKGRSSSAYKVQSPSFSHLGRQNRLDPPGRVGILAGVLGHPLDGDLVHPSLVLPFADQVGDRNHGVVEQALRQLVEVVVALAAFEQVAQNHRIGERAIEIDARALEREDVVLDILADLLDTANRPGWAGAPPASLAGSSTLDPAGPRTGK